MDCSGLGMQIPAGITWHITEVPTPDLTSEIPTVLGWMRDVMDRVGSLGAAMMGPYMAWIEMVEGMDYTLEDFERASRFLMNTHAIARNDIYDMTTRTITLNEYGFDDGKDYTVSRKESDIRKLLYMYHNRLKDL